MARSSGLQELERVSSSILAEVDQPIKVALVGRISAGKSTLLNALLGKRLAPTAVETKTLNVNCFRHVCRSPHLKEEIRVIYNNGDVRFMELSYLEHLVSVDEDVQMDELADVKIVDCFIDHESLLFMDIIDTPGLLSADVFDSEKTRALIGNLTERPDIILYLYMNLTKSDLEEIKLFQRNLDSFSGMCTIGILAKADSILSNTGNAVIGSDYIDLAEDKIRRQYNNKEISAFRYHFCHTVPVAQVYAQAADALTEEDYYHLKRYIVDSGLFKSQSFNIPVSNADLPRFLREKPELDSIISREQRMENWRRIEPEALKYIAYHFQHYPNASYEEIRDSLRRYSNVGVLKELLFTNFDHRAIYYKIGSLMDKLTGGIREQRNGKGVSVINVLNSMSERCHSFIEKIDEAFLPYYYLREYYAQLGGFFNDTIWDDVLRLFGEVNCSEDKHEFSPGYWKELADRYKLLMLYSTASKLEAIAAYCERHNK